MIRHFAAAALTLAASTVFAQSENSIATSAFELHTLPSLGDYPGSEATVLSDQNGVTALRLTSMDALRLWENWSNPYSTVDGDHYNVTFDAQVRAGFRITGIELSGSMFGDLNLAPVNSFYFDSPGAVGNRALVDVSVGASALPTAWSPTSSIGSVLRTNFEGTQSFLAGTRSLDLQGGFRLNIQGSAVATVVSAVQGNNCHEYYYSCANVYPTHHSAVGVQDAVLTIYTQPVPEPSTYVLLTAGLFTLGAITRRRRQG